MARHGLVTIRICDERSEASAEPRMSWHQKDRFLRLLGLAQCEENERRRISSCSDSIDKKPVQIATSREQEEIGSLRWLGEKVMKDQFVYRFHPVPRSIEIRDRCFVRSPAAMKPPTPLKRN